MKSVITAHKTHNKTEYDSLLFDDGDTGDNEKEDGQHIGENKDAEADHVRMHGQEHGGQKGDLWLSKEQKEKSVKKQIRQQGDDDRKDAQDVRFKAEDASPESVGKKR